MITIDFHIHTCPSQQKNESFCFSLEKLKEYTTKRNIDAIAITNHNLFDITNYQSIKNSLRIQVYPGIEVDVGGGHMLVISSENNVASFDQACSKISQIIAQNDTLDTNQFLSIFNDRHNYLFIPHYKKKPVVSRDILDKLAPDIFCGEVDNQNKFIRLYKEKNELTPVLFSDWRPTQDNEIPFRSTFIDINNVDFWSIKEALKDKEKVFINKEKSRDFFSILDDGTQACAGLNVIVGKRSSGKTFTLDTIFKCFNNPQKTKSIKYIKQFELIERDSEEKEEVKFNAMLADKSSLFIQEYLDEFKTIVDRIQTIDLENERMKANGFLSTLIEFANNVEKHDSFAKVPLFSQQQFETSETNEIEALIQNVQNILDNVTYADLIKKHLNKKALIELFKDLVLISREIALRNTVTQYSNKIIEIVKKQLTVESNQDPITSFNLIKYAQNVYDIEMFERIACAIKSERTINEKRIGKFKVVAKRLPVSSASDLQRIYKKNVQFSQHYSLYKNPYLYLMSIKQANVIPVDQLFKSFVRIEYVVLNESGMRVSGGERAEFNLEQKLNDADEYEMLLIDEPESSFDNLFLKDYINSKIKNLSKKMPVFVSTHNNVVGASLKADYILFTDKTIVNGQTVFRVFGGEITSKELKTTNNETIKNRLVQLDCFEGGEESYIDRSHSYENIKN